MEYGGEARVTPILGPVEAARPSAASSSTPAIT